MNSRLYIFGFLIAICIACKPKFEAPEYSYGETNPERLLMLGGTFASGYTDDALFRYGQEHSMAS